MVYIIDVGIMILLIFIFLCSVREKEASVFSGEKKESLAFLFPMSWFLWKKTGFIKRWEKKGKYKEWISALEVGMDQKQCQKKFLVKNTSRIICFIFLTCCLSLLAGTIKEGKKLLEGGKISRPAYGGQKEVIALYLEAKEETCFLEEEVEISMEPRKLTEAEFQQEAIKAEEYLKSKLLGQNKSREHVDKPLNLVTEIPGQVFSVEWRTGLDSLVSEDGNLISSQIPQMGQDTVLTAIISYEEWEKSSTFSIRVYPETRSWEEKTRDAVAEEIRRVQEESSSGTELVLPQKVGNVQLSYEEKAENKAAVILGAGFLAAGILALSARQKLEKQMKKREIELRMDYPEIMGKFTLLLGAGMTTKGAWMKIVSDYLDKCERGKEGKRYSYEEMLVTCRELENGVTEGNAYDNFGRRVKLLPYLKFSTLLVQNIRKGSKGLSEILEYEAGEAYEERKEAAKRLGEEAGTKLLFPMVIMMTLVFALIMIPAFMKFAK